MVWRCPHGHTYMDMYHAPAAPLPVWILVAQDEWVFALPPYRGVLVKALAPGSERPTAFLARIERPTSTVPGPRPFDTIKDAQTWVEGEIYRRMAEAGHEVRRHGSGRRKDNHG